MCSAPLEILFQAVGAFLGVVGALDNLVPVPVLVPLCNSSAVATVPYSAAGPQNGSAQLEA